MPANPSSHGEIVAKRQQAIQMQTWKVCLVFTLAVYALLITISPHVFVYDESYYISIAERLSRSGLTGKFIYEMDAPTGILYGLVHWLGSVVTSFRPPLIRVLNFIFACGSCYLLFRISRATSGNDSPGVGDSRGIAVSVAWLVAPISGVITCLALTEMSAIFFSLLGSCAIIEALNHAKNQQIPVKSLILGGVAYGVSIWGRQNYILVPMLSFLLLVPLNWKRLSAYLLILCTSLPFFVVPVLIWGGLVPPAVDFVAKGLLPTSFVFSFYYLSVILCLVCPGMYKLLTRKKIVGCLGASLLLMALFPVLVKTPSEFFVRQHLGETGVVLVGIVSSLLMLTLSLAALVSLLQLSAGCARNKYSDFFLASSLLLLASNIKIIHQFSSRYVTLAVPYVLLAVFMLDRRQSGIGRSRLALLATSLILSSFFALNYYRSVA